MKILLASLLLSSWVHAATDSKMNASPSASSSQATETKQRPENQKEPSAVPCIPQETREEKLDDLAKLEGEGESHSTNCPAQGAIKDMPDAPPEKTVE